MSVSSAPRFSPPLLGDGAASPSCGERNGNDQYIRTARGPANNFCLAAIDPPTAGRILAAPAPMKILDRYVISTFVKNYLISFFVLVGMYVILDMVFNFDELVEVQERAGATGL